MRRTAVRPSARHCARSGTDPFSLVNTTKSPLLITKLKDRRVSTPLAINLEEIARSKIKDFDYFAIPIAGGGLFKKCLILHFG